MTEEKNQPIFRLSSTEPEATIPHRRMSILSNGPSLRKSSLCPTKELFRSLVLSFSSEIDYTIVNSRRIHACKYSRKEERWKNLPSCLMSASSVLCQKKPEP